MSVRHVRPGAADLTGDVGELAASAIQSSSDIARLLRAASPHGAAPFACAMHERACQAQDEEQSEFWSHVLDDLRQRRPITAV